MALKTKGRGIEAVAREAGVKPGTVRDWCSEFGIGTGTGGNSSALAAPTQEDDLSRELTNSQDDLSRPAEEEVLDVVVDKAGESLAVEMSAWLSDSEGRRQASERLGEVISDWEAEHGAFTPEELEAARAQLSE